MSVLFCGTFELDLSSPRVMGILNLTPDSFYDGGKYPSMDIQMNRVEQMLAEGAAIIDLGAVSTRPGAAEVSEQEEISRLLPAIKEISRHFPDCIISVDTFRPEVARQAVDRGASMINDIYGGRFEPGMLETVAKLNLPYILMHMKGTPKNMQEAPSYSNVVAEVAYFFETRVTTCRNAGIKQVIIDPGFGFGKTIDQNFELLDHLEEFKTTGAPLMVGFSRKSMIYKLFKTEASEALNGTTALNTIALLKGADILRVHDVKEALEAITLVGMLNR